MITNYLNAANKEIIITFINRIIQNCAIMGKAPIYINKVGRNGKKYFIQIQYFEEVEKDIKPFIKMLEENNKGFYEKID